VRIGKLLDVFRDRVVQRSQLGKRRLDAAFTRRQLDDKWTELGERYSEHVRRDLASVPGELAGIIEEIRSLEQKLEKEREDVASLEHEAAKE
jgi:hypothetical protein